MEKGNEELDILAMDMYVL